MARKYTTVRARPIYTDADFEAQLREDIETARDYGCTGDRWRDIRRRARLVAKKHGRTAADIISEVYDA